MKLCKLVASACFLAGLSLPAMAGEAHFCRDYAQGQCVSPLLNGAEVKLDSLERNAQGERVLHLFSAQSVQAGQTLFHQWETAQPVRGGVGCKHRWSGAAPGEAAKAALEALDLGAGPCKASFGVAAKASGKNFRLHSWRVIYGPGKVAATVIGPDGQPMSASAQLEIVE